MSDINLVSIGEKKFLNYHFVIPYYQRGYRWTEKEVKELLNDVLEFQDKNKRGELEKGEFYCLQPVVVVRKKGEDDVFEVVDGQQRLTTLFIILTFLKQMRIADKGSAELFSLEYETREKEGVSSKVFLSNLEEITKIDKSNPDFFHISKAYLTVKEWFEENNISKYSFLNTLMDSEIIDGVDTRNNVRFIWYEVSEEELEDEEDGVIEIFNRLNKGKIPLTNAELVKALFFISDHQEEERKKLQLQMGFEWDNIEYALQNKNFWYFLTKENYKGSNHIEFIFQIIAEKYLHLTNLAKYKKDKLFTFLVFNELISKRLIPSEGNPSKQETKDFLWKEIKSYSRLFTDFYNDNEYYHLIGFLNHSSSNLGIAEIVKLSELSSKDNFKNKLLDKIRAIMPTDIFELSYEHDYATIKDLLLLYNILITKKSGFIKFPFELYIEQKWSLEHIHAQNTQLLTPPQKRNLLENQLVYFKDRNKEFSEKIEKILNEKKINDHDFDVLQTEIFSLYSNNILEHSIQNLALLSVEDNSTLNNNIFPIKRDLVRSLDEKGSFIPIGTKNVFLKYYSENVEQNVSWDISDQISYSKHLKQLLTPYLPKPDIHEIQLLETAE